MNPRRTIAITVRLRSGRVDEYGPFELGVAAEAESTASRVALGDGFPFAVRTTPQSGDQLHHVEYRLRCPMGNFEHVIAPDSGRWFMNMMHVTGFWKFGRHARSRIDDIKVPLYLFTGADGHVKEAMGVIGALIETDFELHEPVSNRALNVHTRGVEVGIRRGTDDYPLSPRRLDADGSLSEQIYVP